MEKNTKIKVIEENRPSKKEARVTLNKLSEFLSKNWKKKTNKG